MISRPSLGPVGGAAALVPQATMMFSAVTARVPASLVIATRWESTNDASPSSTVMSFRARLFRTTRVSDAITASTRAMRSAISGRLRMPYSSSALPPTLEMIASRSVLEGMVPVKVQTPPTRRRFSIIATRL